MRAKPFLACLALVGLALFLLVVASGLVSTIVNEVGATPFRWFMVLTFIIVIGALGVWCAKGAVEGLAAIFGTHWDIYGDGGAVSGAVVTLCGAVVSGGVMHARVVRTAERAAVSTAELMEVGPEKVLASLRETNKARGIESVATLSLMATLAGVSSLGLIDVHVAEQRAWSKSSLLARRRHGAPIKTLLLQRGGADVASAPALEATFTAAVSELAAAEPDRTRFELIDVLYRVQMTGGRLAPDAPPKTAYRSGAPEREDVATNLATFYEDIHGDDLRFDSLPTPLAAVLHHALVLAGGV